VLSASFPAVKSSPDALADAYGQCVRGAFGRDCTTDTGGLRRCCRRVREEVCRPLAGLPTQPVATPGLLRLELGEEADDRQGEKLVGLGHALEIS